ncbi:MAG TPA: hypothetical protein VNS88_09240 [Nitrospiraceae bacterium]|nr:hypothetical protein [Nitrospiraceae bacterium]
MSASQEPTLSTEPAAPAEETSSEARNTATASPIPSIPCEVVRYPFAAVMALSTYFAYHVSLQGVANASYELHAADDEAAKVEAKYFLKFHPSIEVWQGARWIARFTQEPGWVKGH